MQHFRRVAIGLEMLAGVPASRLLAGAAFLAALAFTPGARGESSLRLRVVAWNVWGVPAITSRLDERMAALPDAIAALEPDLVVLQELWTKTHAESVEKRLRERGFRDFRWFSTEGGATGLFLASKLPLRAGTFRPFSIGTIPHTVWHLDWLVEKGVADAVMTTPLGDLRVEATHLQAQYRTDAYAAERLAQAVEVVTGGRNHAGEALILAGDFNGPGGELPRRVIRDLGGFEDASPSSSEDTVYVRGSRDLAVRVVNVRPALEEETKLVSGVRERLSDHAAVLVELELTRCANCAPAPRVTSATRDAAVASLGRAVDITPFRVAVSLFTALALFVLGVGWKRRVGKFTSGSRLRVALRLLGLSALGVAFAWTAYLGAFYYPTRAKALREVARGLGS